MSDVSRATMSLRHVSFVLTASGQSTAPPIVYSIETANPEVYYAPIYDPGVVYGALCAGVPQTGPTERYGWLK